MTQREWESLGRPSDADLADYGQNQITVGQDLLLKRLHDKHGDRRYHCQLRAEEIAMDPLPGSD